MFTKCRPNSRTRARVSVRFAFALCLTIAAIGGAVFQERGEPVVCAQTGSQPSGQQCASGDTQKTTICHVPPGRAEQARTSCVANSAVQAHLANHPEDCVGGCPCRPDVTYSTCAPVAVTRLHGEGFLGNTRLARIENGKVPCVHIETGENRMCTFNAGSGEWVEAADGNYARMGQAITPQGEPGGEWAVAARRNDQRTVPCVAPSGRDTQGIATGQELVSSCVIETWGSSLNATGLPLLNYATLEVCISNYPHPDAHDGGPVLTRVISDGLPAPPGDDHGGGGGSAPATYCYRGEGAALNDPNGTERFFDHTYYRWRERCHVAYFSDYETYAAKRPDTYNGAAISGSPLTWKPIAYGIAIANPQ